MSHFALNATGRSPGRTGLTTLNHCNHQIASLAVIRVHSLTSWLPARISGSETHCFLNPEAVCPCLLKLEVGLICSVPAVHSGACQPPQTLPGAEPFTPASKKPSGGSPLRFIMLCQYIMYYIAQQQGAGTLSSRTLKEGCRWNLDGPVEPCCIGKSLLQCSFGGYSSGKKLVLVVLDSQLLHRPAMRPFVPLLQKPSAPDLEVGFQACSLAMVPRVAIDGPFGAPAQNFNDYEVLLLVVRLPAISGLIFWFSVSPCMHSTKL